MKFNAVIKNPIYRIKSKLALFRNLEWGEIPVCQFLSSR